MIGYDLNHWSIGRGLSPWCSFLILRSLSIALVFRKKTGFIDTHLMALVGTPSSQTKGGFVGSVESLGSSHVASKQYSETSSIDSFHRNSDHNRSTFSYHGNPARRFSPPIRRIRRHGNNSKVKLLFTRARHVAILELQKFRTQLHRPPKKNSIDARAPFPLPCLDTR